MHLLHFFINDLSHPFNGFSRLEKIRCIQDLITTLRQIKATTKNRMTVICAAPLPRCDLGSGDHIGNLLQGDDYRDEWRFVRSLEDKNSFSDDEFRLTSETRYKGTVSEAMNWAYNLETAVVSFSSNNDWSSPHLQVTVTEVQDDDSITDHNTNVRNISSSEHCEHWRDFLSGEIQSKSAEVFNCTDFSIKMYFRDHNPPHIHVFEGENAAVVSIDKCEVKQGYVSPRVIKQVVKLIVDNRVLLNTNWASCRNGRLPRAIGGES